MSDRVPSRRAHATRLTIAALLFAPALYAQSKVDLAFRDSVPAWLAAAHVPGMVVAVIESGRVTHTESFGVLRPNVPMSPRALFNVASLTKPVVAVTTLRLASAGRLALEGARSIASGVLALRRCAWEAICSM